MQCLPRINLKRFLSVVSSFAAVLGIAHAQQPADANEPTVKVETRVVLVDAVVTDKKGHYVQDLGANDFKLWEDGKEQPVTSFTREDANPDPAHPHKHYLVLFFDNSTMEFGDQAKARDAAAKFIDSNASPDHLIAVVEFGGTLRITQNFTTDSERLKKVVAGIKFSTVSPNSPSPDLASTALPQSSVPSLGPPAFGGLEADFGARSVFLALRNVAKGLAGVPGRKTLVMLSAGFQMTLELESELNATIDACNKANVAVYPIDVRGLVAPVPTPIPSGASLRPQTNTNSQRLVSASLAFRSYRASSFLHLASFAAEPAEPPQHAGGGGGGGGGGRPGGGGGGAPGGGAGGGGGRGGTGGGGTGGRGGTGGSGGKGGTTGGGTGGRGGSTGGGGVRGGGTTAPTNYAPINPPQALIPQIPDVSANQQFLYQLAEGTGGFVIVNTNDLLGGMERIAKDQSEYYLLGYRPPDSADGSCHSLKVKVNRGGTQVRFRSGYCKVRPQDLLAGSTTGKDLETRASGEMKGNVTASLQTPYFYTAPNVARVDLAMEIPSKSLHFEKVKGKQHAEVNILGIAYRTDGGVAARFSDTVNLDLDGKKEVEEFQNNPMRYEKQFDIAPGAYNLRIAFSSGNDVFGKLDNPLSVLPYDGKKIAVSAVVLSNNLARVSDLNSAYDSELLEDNKPLVIRGMQIFPSATNHFKTTDSAAAYIEVYDPLLLGDKPPQIGLEYRIVNVKTGEQKLDIGYTDTKDSIKPGNPSVPVGLKLPLDTLTPGSYRVDLRAQDSIGNGTEFRSAEFEVE
ncbi:MAG TPA: VWA domain-containing protein [Candidatus Sulfotelmatobacter sp.]|nr:VWA domain-containing protein [Candidatus Sulfotelmatobacter sp.]